MMAFALFVIYSRESREALLSSLTVCARSLVPSLFPFAVLGALIGSGVAELPLALTSVISVIFGVSRTGAKALLPGLFAGFPVGCSGALGLYERGEIGPRELCRICAFSCTPSIGFVVAGVGEGIFHDKRLGALVYLSVIVSVFVLGVLTRGKVRAARRESAEIFLTSSDVGIPRALSDAISKSASAMLVMCAFVAMFSQVSLVADKIFENLPNGEILSLAVRSFSEVSDACLAASDVLGRRGASVCVMACAWSGLSVHMQTLALCSRVKANGILRHIFLIRGAITLLSVLIFFVISRFFSLY